MNGWINLNKPVGMTSAQAVSRVKRALPKKTKIGHAGTLDPLANGVLPLAVGEATKMIPLLHMDDKTYRFSIIWGEERATDDAEGEVTKTSNKRVTREDVEAVLPQFRGTITQIPPAFSAIKIDGERAYDRARAGEILDMPARQVDIYDLEIESHDEAQTILICTCGTGTYVRSLCRDIARKCGSAGYVGLLTRTRVGPFALDSAFLLDKEGQIVDKDALHAAFLPVDYGLDDILAVTVSRFEETRLRRGQEVVMQSAVFAEPILIYGEDGLIGIGAQDNRTLKPKRILTL